MYATLPPCHTLSRTASLGWTGLTGLEGGGMARSTFLGGSQEIMFVVGWVFQADGMASSRASPRLDA